MPAPELDLHGNHWINTIGHSAGVVVFANLGWLLYRDARRSGQAVRALPIASTVLALAFDLFLLCALGFRLRDSFVANAFAAAAFACLSLLPGVLFDVALRRRGGALRFSAYALGGLCATLHLADVVAETPGTHAAALIMLAGGFSALALAAFWRYRHEPEIPRACVCLFLLSLSFLHFLSAAAESGFWAELILHHAGIPAALFVVLQEYRFLLLDAFLRLAANGAVAGLFVSVGWMGRAQAAAWAKETVDNPFALGLLFVAVAALLFAFAFLRELVQNWLTRQVFLRPDAARMESTLRRLEGAEDEILASAARQIADYFRAERFGVFPEQRPGFECSAHLRFLKGDSLVLQLGGRRFLSEDLELLEGFAALVAREVDRARAREMEKLVAQAEWRALHNQIQPHFLFNALNALYGSIPRTAVDARRLVLSLSEVFRYFLTTAKPMIRLREELRIVEAYLEIERARLGPRLVTQVDVAPVCLELMIPVLSIQPLVENAIKHGVAAAPGPGEVRLSANVLAGRLVVLVEDTGPGMGKAREHPDSTKVGLKNVERRLALQFGARAEIRFEDRDPGTRVRMEFPAQSQESPVDTGELAAQAKLM